MTKTKIRCREKSGALFAAALLTGSFMSSFGGQTIAKSDGKQTIPPPTVESNPLCFMDGLFCFDVQERFRWEIRNNNFDFNDDANVATDDNWFLQRFRIGLMIKPTDWFRIYAQAQDSREINSDRADFPGTLGAEGDDAFDLRQGYIEFSNYKKFPLGLKIGRQILSYGDERLIGPLDWNNIGRTFDAVKVRWEEKSWWVDTFASTVVVPERGSYNQSDLGDGNETDRDQIFSGIYFSTNALKFQTTDLYALYLHEHTNPKFQPLNTGDTDFVTLGLRVKSTPGAFAHQTVVSDGKSVADGKSAPPPPAPPKPVGFDYEAELAFQTGQVRGLDLTAFAAHAGAGYTFDTAWKPRFGLEYNFATGDTDPADGDIETFQNLFPTNHKFYGIMDLTAWQNMHQAAALIRIAPCKTVTVDLNYRAFFIASNDDFWYRANGIATVRPLTPAARNASSYEGSQIETVVTWNAKKWLQIQGGYAHFFAGDYLADTGPSDDADFGYLQASITF